MENDKVGCLIREARISKGYTQKDVAEKIGLTDKAVSKWECGKSFPDITLIGAISQILDIDVTMLVGVADNSREVALMMKELEKKIKIRLGITAVILLMVVTNILMRFLCSFSSYAFFLTALSNFIYFMAIIVGVTCLISSIFLIIKRKKMYDEDKSIK